MADRHKCITVAVAKHLNMLPNHVVLDWGSGCGHKLTWLKQLFGVDGIGIDIVKGNVEWAQRFSAGKFCHADGNDLSWFPEAYVDFVISCG